MPHTLSSHTPLILTLPSLSPLPLSPPLLFYPLSPPSLLLPAPSLSPLLPSAPPTKRELGAARLKGSIVDLEEMDLTQKLDHLKQHKEWKNDVSK